MKPIVKNNLDRLLKPRHVAVIGGRDAETVATECRRIGFNGSFWPVNPKRSHIGGHRCFPTIEDLPEAPDAVFLAIPKEPAIDALNKLNSMGAGGVVCYTAGFGETGVEGEHAERRLVAASGDLALVGPNCYGVINYVDRVALWPFTHGGSYPGYGAAIITQSGMLSSDFTMSQREVPFAYMVSAGNQTILRLENFVDELCEHPEVRAIGIHIEGLKDIPAFERAALKSLQLGKPIVALKTGTSKLGSSLTVSHTGSLSGTDELYNALFDRLGIIRVKSPSQLLETLKFICVGGVPRGKQLAGLTCSGGGATMLADYADRFELNFTSLDAKTSEELRIRLPPTATVSNPLDYTTPIWGIEEKTRPVFDTLLSLNHDAAIIVQDYPAPGLDDSKQYYRNDTLSFIAATKARHIPGAVCSTIPENLDNETRKFLVDHGVAPMQGIEECMTAIAHAAWYGVRRSEIQNSDPKQLFKLEPNKAVRLLDEAAGKNLLRKNGIPIPEGRIGSGSKIAQLSNELGFPVVLKLVSALLPHKTEAGAIKMSLRSSNEVSKAVEQIKSNVEIFNSAALTDVFLVETMVAAPVAELMVNIRYDSEFGFVMTLATGGILVELFADSTTILLPTSRNDLVRALSRLKIKRLLDGYRGQSGANMESLLSTLERLTEFATDPLNKVAEIEINPLFVGKDVTCAIDVLMQIT